MDAAGWGLGAINNNINWLVIGIRGLNQWGSIHKVSYSGETNIVGLSPKSNIKTPPPPLGKR